eukprot:4093423-Amphidinium_carterae.1
MIFGQQSIDLSIRPWGKYIGVSITPSRFAIVTCRKQFATSKQLVFILQGMGGQGLNGWQPP